MAHSHSVYDADPHFTIDPITRVITNQSSSKTTIMQNDHNSERFSFKMPRLVEEHDMMECNRVQVHYINIGGNMRNVGLYEITDMQLYSEDENTIVCSWLISRNATQLVGTLNFILRFACVTNDELDYVWNTAVYSGISISAGIDNSDDIVEQYADILENWYNDLVTAGSTSLGSISDAETKAIRNIGVRESEVIDNISKAGGVVVSETEPENVNVSAWIKETDDGSRCQLVEVSDFDQLNNAIARNDKRLTNIEQGIPPELFETDLAVAYTKEVPEKALPFAEISKIGGMTYKDGSTLKSAKVTEIASVGVNLIDLKDMPIAGSNRFDIPIAVTEGKYWLSIFNSDGTEDGWKRGTTYAARFMYDDENIVLGIDYGGVVTKEQAAQINKLRIFIAPNLYTGTSTTFTAMLNKGENRAPLIPFFKRTIPIPEAVRLENGINGDVHDYIERREDGSRKKVVRCGVKVLDGTEDWVVAQYTNLTAYLGDFTLGEIGKHLVCSHFQEYTDGISWKTDGTNGVAVEGLGEGAKSFFFGITGIATNANAWKAYLATQYANGNPVTIVYELATPIVTDISDILTSDNYIEVERGGTITAVNENGFDVPSVITYMLEEETV